MMLKKSPRQENKRFKTGQRKNTQATNTSRMQTNKTTNLTNKKETRSPSLRMIQCKKTQDSMVLNKNRKQSDTAGFFPPKVGREGTWILIS